MKNSAVEMAETAMNLIFAMWINLLAMQLLLTRLVCLLSSAAVVMGIQNFGLL